eukprot:13862896-Ditylum_brightwellii.AAC.1
MRQREAKELSSVLTKLPMWQLLASLVSQMQHISRTAPHMGMPDELSVLFAASEYFQGSQTNRFWAGLCTWQVGWNDRRLKLGFTLNVVRSHQVLKPTKAHVNQSEVPVPCLSHLSAHTNSTRPM